MLPAAMAIGKNHIGTMAGKLNGLMMPTTPSGSRLECTSTPVETLSEWPPLSRCEMPQANSTTSWPREISPMASESTLPCSAVMIAASSSLRELSSSRNANITCVRRASEVRPHSRAAASAAAMTCLGVARGGERDPAGDPPGGGVGDVGDRPLVPANGAPSPQWSMVPGDGHSAHRPIVVGAGVPTRSRQIVRSCVAPQPVMMSAMLTVADVLQMPSVRGADPEVLAGAASSTGRSAGCTPPSWPTSGRCCAVATWC